MWLKEVKAVDTYRPGNFYRRELPCLLSVLQLVPVLPEAAVVDGYVWLPPGDRPGLGAHLYDAMGRQIPVIGIAKTAFAGVESCVSARPVLRGISRKPLFVTAVGMEPDIAALRVREMAGKHRVPEIGRLADRLSRSRTCKGGVFPEPHRAAMA